MQKKLLTVLCSALMISGTVFSQNLPLSAGSSYPLTGDLHFSADQSIKWGSYYFSTSQSTGNMLFNANSVTFNSGLNVGGNIAMNENAVVKTIWNSGYGGAVQLLRSDANSNRWARIGIVDNGGNWVDGVHISSVGNVGVGTISPIQRLTVNGHLAVMGGNRSMVWNPYNNEYSYLETDASNNLILGTAAVEKMRITSGGNAGIGTASPTERLHVTGGRIYANGTGTGSGFTLNNWTMYQTSSDVFNLGYNGTEVLTAASGGNVGIGTTSPSEKLTVNGNVLAKKLKVTQSGWPDYVFAEGYKLKSLALVESFIKQNGHLPDVPSAKEVENKGLDVGDNQAVLLKKIEELTLYVIDLQKQVNELKKAAQK